MNVYNYMLNPQAVYSLWITNFTTNITSDTPPWNIYVPRNRRTRSLQKSHSHTTPAQSPTTSEAKPYSTRDDNSKLDHPAGSRKREPGEARAMVSRTTQRSCPTPRTHKLTNSKNSQLQELQELPTPRTPRTPRTHKLQELQTPNSKNSKNSKNS